MKYPFLKKNLSKVHSNNIWRTVRSQPFNHHYIIIQWQCHSRQAFGGWKDLSATRCSRWWPPGGLKQEKWSFDEDKWRFYPAKNVISWWFETLSVYFFVFSFVIGFSHLRLVGSIGSGWLSFVERLWKPRKIVGLEDDFPGLRGEPQSTTVSSSPVVSFKLAAGSTWIILDLHPSYEVCSDRIGIRLYMGWYPYMDMLYSSTLFGLLPTSLPTSRQA